MKQWDMNLAGFFESYCP